MEQKIGNQQDYDLTNNQIQVILTGTFGDGCVTQNINGTSKFSTNSIHEEYVDFKGSLLGDLFSSKNSKINMGFKQNIIHQAISKSDKRITKIHNLSLEEKLNMLDDLGLALWFYDDGSLHKRNGFFNLNTHSFSEEIHQEILVPYFENKGFKPEIFKDKKKDGRVFSYLYFGRHYGAFEVMQTLQKTPIDCFSYKLWSPETIQEWSKLKAQLKSEGREISPRKFANILLGKSSL